MIRPRSIGLLLAFVTLVIYLPATSGQFINYDDPDYVADNPVVQRGLTWAGVKWAFMGAHASNWHPLTWLSHMADCDLFRLKPGGHHLVNILFHSLNAALVFALLFRLTKAIWPSAFVAALFAWHPLHVESVAWIAERKDVLSTFFALLTLLSYARYAENRSKTGSLATNASTLTTVLNSRFRIFDYQMALVFFVLALLSKPMPVTIPLVMLLLDYWPLERFQISQSHMASSGDVKTSLSNFQHLVVFEKWPFFLLSAASCVITFLAQHAVAVQSLAVVPIQLRLKNALTAYAGYLWKMVWPVDLGLFYPLQAQIAWHVMAESLIILVGVSILAWRERKTSPWLMVGWLWFLVTLIPVIGLVQVGGQAMADRYSYFPLVGIFLAIAFSAKAAADRFVFLKKWWTAAAALMLGACVLLTERQLQFWRDSETLFSHALAVSQSDTAHINLAVAFRAQNRMTEALNQFIMAWRFNPDSEALAYGNIALILDGQDKTNLALICYQKAVKQKCLAPPVYENYGLLLTKLGRFDEAMNQFSAAAQLDPASARPYFLMANLLLQQGRDAEAITRLHEALQLEPDNLRVLILTASVLAAEDDPHVRDGAEARRLAERLVKLTGDHQPAALDALAVAYAELGQFDEAVQTEQQAVKQIQATGPEEDVAAMQKRLESFQKHQPWRESFKKNWVGG